MCADVAPRRDGYPMHMHVTDLVTADGAYPTRGRVSLETPPAFENIVNRLSPPDAKQFKWIQFKICCPVSATHKVQIWNEPGKCPRCAHYLEKSAPPFRIWD